MDAAADYFFLLLQALSSQERSKILLDVADALEANEEEILAENEADVAAAQQAGYEKALISRLALKPGKVRHCSLMVDLVLCKLFSLNVHLLILVFLLNLILDFKSCKLCPCAC